MDAATKGIIDAGVKYYLPLLKAGMEKQLSIAPAAMVKRGQALITKAYNMTLDALETWLKTFDWKEEKIDHITPPEIMAQMQYGDCDCFAWLIQRIRPKGTIYLICNITAGKVTKFKEWHYIYFENGCVWSNFRLESSSCVSISQWVKKHYKFANLLIPMNADLSGIGKVIEL